MIGEKTLELLKQVLAESSYTVAICGSVFSEPVCLSGFL